MSTTTLQFTLLKNGSPYDATAVKVQSPPSVVPAIGVIRTDNSSSVVPPNTAYTHISTGVYQLTFTDPTEGLTYNYWRQVVVDGETLYDNATSTLYQPTPTAIYWTWTQFVNRFGLKNIVLSSNKDGKSADPNFAAIQDSFDYAADEIHSALRGGVLAVPLDFTLYSNIVPQVVSRWGMVIAYADLYDVRGWEDKNMVGNKMSRMVRQTYDDISLYKSGIKQMLAAPAVDHRGNTIDLSHGTAFGPPVNSLGWNLFGPGYFPGFAGGWGYGYLVPDGVLTFFGACYLAA